MTGRETVCLPVFLRTLPFGGRAGKGSKGRPMPRLAASALQGEGVCEASGRGRSRAGRIRCLPAPEGWGGLMASHLGNGGGGGLEPLCQSVSHQLCQWSCDVMAATRVPRRQTNRARAPRKGRRAAYRTCPVLALCSMGGGPWVCLFVRDRPVCVRACVRA